MSDTHWEELAYTLFEEAGDALFLFDPETEQLREVNPMAQRLSGFTRRELLETKVTYLFRSEVQGGVQRLRQAFRRTGLFHSQEGFWLRHKQDGIWVPVNLTVTRLHTEPQTMGLITARDISERREAHALLQKAEAELRRVMSSVSDCLWSAEIDDAHRWSYCYFSPVIERITGQPPQFFMSGLDRWFGIVHPDDLPRVQKGFARLKQGQAGSEEYRVCHPDGNLRWVRDSVMVTQGVDGRALLLDGVVTDITERKRADEALRESEARRRLLLEQMPAIVWTTDRDLRFTSSMGAGLRGLNLEPNQVVGLTLSEYFGTQDPDFIPLAAHRQAVAGESVTYEFEWENHAFHTHVESLHDSDGRVIGSVGVALDITAHKRAIEALRRSEAKYRSLIDNLTQCVFLKDKDLRFVAANKPFCQTVGLAEDGIAGKTDFDFYPRDLAEKFQADDRLVLSEGKRLEQEEQSLIQGQTRVVRVVKSPLYDDRGQTTGVLGIFWDVTEQHNLESQLRQAQKMEAVGQLAGGIAHDFNNLLTGILGNLSLASSEFSDGHPCRELLSSAEAAGLRAAELTRQLLGFARRTPLRAEPLNLNGSIDETVRLLRRTIDPRIAVQVHSAADLWEVQADAGQMSQVLMNLCLNARDAMPSGGTLTLETANVTIEPASASLHLEGRPGDYVRLRVTDTGTGMPPEVRAHLFEPFFTTKAPGKGTGLGLAMVFGIVNQHQGWIECHSEVGRGTCFDIYLPRLVGSATASVVAASTSDVRGGHETILVADDEEVVSRLARASLERFGYHVLTAADGEEALQIYRERQNEIDLIILDLAMPKLSGADTLRELRKINPQVCVLISSGYSSGEDYRAVERDGAIGFIAKPYRPVDLARSVRQALDLVKG